MAWSGRITHIDRGSDILSVAFYVRHSVEKDKWVRESRLIDRLHVNSVVGVLKGMWIGTTYLTWQETE